MRVTFTFVSWYVNEVAVFYEVGLLKVTPTKSHSGKYKYTSIYLYTWVGFDVSLLGDRQPRVGGEFPFKLTQIAYNSLG